MDPGFRTFDFWRCPGTSAADDITYDASTSTYYLSSPFQGVLSSTDGLNWTSLQANLPSPLDQNVSIVGNIHAQNGRVGRFAGRPGAAERALITSNDLGQTWSFTGPPVGSVGHIQPFGSRLVLSSAGDTTLTQGAYVSDDDGATWEQRKTLRGGTYDIRANNNYLFGVTGFSTDNAPLVFSATNGDSFDALDVTGLPAGLNGGFWIEPTASDLFLLIPTDVGIKLYRRAISEFNLTPSTQVVLSERLTSGFVNVGASASFRALGAGQGTVSYRWQRDGMDLPGQTSPTLDLTNLQVSDSGTYTIVVTSTSGTATEIVGSLNVLPTSAGYQDLRFKSAPFPRSGRSAIYNDLRIVKFDGNVADLYSAEGVHLSQVDYPDARWREPFFDTRGNLMAWGEYGLARFNPDTLALDSSFVPLDFPGTFVQVNDVEEIAGRGYAVALFGGAQLGGTQEMPPVALFSYDGNYIVVVGPS